MSKWLGLMARKYLVPILVDALIVAGAFLAALFLRFDGSIPSQYFQNIRLGIVPLALIFCIVNLALGMYNRFWRYASSMEVTVLIASAGISTLVAGILDVLLTGLLRTLWNEQRPLPLGVVLMAGIFVMGGFALIRYRWRLITGFLWRWRAITRGVGHRVLIIGAGEEGQFLSWRLRNQLSDYEVAGYIDDASEMLGASIHGAKVLGNRHQIPSIVAEKAVDTIIITIPEISGRDFREILSLCQQTSAKIKVLPNISEMVEGNGTLPPLRDISVEDLLGRKSLNIDQEACTRLLANKVVLVTGAGGSIGSELCRQIVQFRPQLLVMMDNNETAIHELATEFALLPGPAKFKAQVSDILHQNILTRAFNTYRPQMVFHAAAYKHVPLMEENPQEALLVNVLGTRLLIDLAQQYGVERFVFISSDKAAEPQGVMGATKRIGELLLLSTPRHQQPLLTAVRFANVLNTRGSVVPTFLKQLNGGNAVTVTHPDMSRFFMGLQEAVALIIQAASFTQGNDIYILSIGEELKIVDLAKRIIRLKGLRIDDDVKIHFTGIRPGEKLREVLYSREDERLEPTAHPNIFRVVGQQDLDHQALLTEIGALVEISEHTPSEGLAQRILQLARTPASSLHPHLQDDAPVRKV